MNKREDISAAAAAGTASAAGTSGAGSTTGSGGAGGAAATASVSYLEGEEKKREVKLYKMPVSERALPPNASKAVAPKAAKRKVPDATIMFNSANEPWYDETARLCTLHAAARLFDPDWTDGLMVCYGVVMCTV